MDKRKFESGINRTSCLENLMCATTSFAAFNRRQTFPAGSHIIWHLILIFRSSFEPRTALPSFSPPTNSFSLVFAYLLWQQMKRAYTKQLYYCNKWNKNFPISRFFSAFPLLRRTNLFLSCQRRPRKWQTIKSLLCHFHFSLKLCYLVSALRIYACFRSQFQPPTTRI